MELPTPKRHEYPVLLLLAVLFGFVCPALNAILPNAGQFRLIHTPVPLGVWVLLDILSECWAGVALFAALRFPLRRCVPLLLMPVLAVALNGAALAAWAGWDSVRGPLLTTLLLEPLIFCCWLLVAAVAKPLARHTPYEWIPLAALLFLGNVLVSAVGFGLRMSVSKFFLSLWSTGNTTLTQGSVRIQFGGVLRAFAAEFLTYALLWGIADQRLFSRIGRLARRAWDATAA